eukprot:9734028-Karenia_brevis.AAC.1
MEIRARRATAPPTPPKREDDNDEEVMQETTQEEKQSCTICREFLEAKPVQALECMHVFHKD